MVKTCFTRGVPQHSCPLQRLQWELSLPAKPSMLAHHCWEQDVTAREVLLQLTTTLTGVLQPAYSPGLEVLEADTTERTAWMLRGGIHKRAVINSAAEPRGRAEKPWQAMSACADT